MVLIKASIVRKKAIIVDFTKAWEITYLKYERGTRAQCYGDREGFKVVDR